MKTILMIARSLIVYLCPFVICGSSWAQSEPQFRPPAVPLVTSDPYLSIWSEADHLNDDVTRHWTHAPHSLISLIRVDGQTYRLMGKEPSSAPPLPQIGLEVTPTRSIYRFTDSHVAVNLTFMTPALPSDLAVYSRPVTYLTWTVSSTDGHPHQVSIYDSTSSELAVNTPDQKVEWSRERFGALTALKVGTQVQNLLRPAGDDVRIDWGYAYSVAREDETDSSIGANDALLAEFERTGRLSSSDDARMPRAVSDDQPVMAFSFDLGSVGAAPVSRHLMIGYDELYSIDYFGQKLRPFWRRSGTTPSALFEAAERDYPQLVRRSKAFDDELVADAKRVGGDRYAQIVALAYRECVAANGLAADGNGQPLFFTKEDTSNGDIATVDVIFPMDPIWVLLSPTLAKASLVSNFAYAGSAHWKFDNAPHDLGTYPRAFGRDDGGEGMPVEESGNMIILTDAIAHAEGNAKFASNWWPQLTRWAHYLERYGLDPEDQLCTDDFMGHLAHNANLSVKAILALAAYGDLARQLGDQATATKYRDEAKTDAAHWVEVAEAGDHSLLAFDKPGTWSQKYNLVWDRLLGLNVFPPSVAQKEIAYYKTQLLRYGLPLDSRTHLTKTDWSIWSATMAENPDDFQTIVSPIYDYLNATTARDPIADSYMTDDAASGGMHARPVVGGFFIKLLSDPATWHKWASRDRFITGEWAPLPKPETVVEVVPTARTQKVVWRYTVTDPGSGWTSPGFADGGWAQGPAGFGTDGTPNAIVGTTWSSDDIWIRRTFVMPNVDPRKLRIIVYHDEDIDVYVNGVLAFSEPSYVNSYQAMVIRPEALAMLRPGQTITLAAHCHQTTGGQGIDVGFGVVKS